MDQNPSDLAVEMDLDTESSGDEDEQAAKTLQPGAEQKRLHSAIFKAWVGREVCKPMITKSQTVQHDAMSIQQIIGRQQTAVIINSPREYQLELFERAKIENTIAVLDTGSGKTLIAILLLRHIIERDLERNAAQQRIAFFLVPSVNLVFQQHKVIEHNMAHKSTRIFGGLFPELWGKERWQSIFDENKSVVCTPEILKQCLEHGFISMSKINLLIFDEAHHTKLDHAYNVIMRQYYKPLDLKQRPRVFGITASPVDVKADGADVVAAAKELEDNLDSTIATTLFTGQMASLATKPTEQVVTYSPSSASGRSKFAESIRSQFSHLAFVTNMLRDADRVATHLGAWCGDAYWQHALKSKIETSSDAPLGRFIDKHYTQLDSAKRDRKIVALKEVLAFVVAHKPKSPLARLPDASSKLIALINCLGRFFRAPNDGRCIVFVEQRLTANILAEYFSHDTGLYIRPAALIGARSNDIGAGSTVRQQVNILAQFRGGDINCIFATSVAEEGLDVPSCNIVIRFDPCSTSIKYIQSRGRARHQDSHFIHLIESNNWAHQSNLEDCQRSEHVMRQFCARLPEAQLLAGDMDDFGDDAGAGTECHVTSTGARLTLSNAMRILANFTSGLPVGEAEENTPRFSVVPAFGGYQSQVFLPSCSPVGGVQGQVKRRKQWAKFSAAYETCKLLLNARYLDDHLLSTIKDRRPLLRQAATALNLRASNMYTMRHKPEWHQNDRPIDDLYGLLITVDRMDRPSRPLLLLSRRKFFALPAFEVFPGSAEPCLVHTQTFETPLSVHGTEKLALLNQFTRHFFSDLFAKKYEDSPQDMPYWVAPARTEINEVVGDDLEAYLDWGAVLACRTDEPLTWTPDTAPESLVGVFLVDPFKGGGGNRYFTRRVVTDLGPNDLSPLRTPGSTKSIIQDSLSIWRGKKTTYTIDPTQPVIEADRLLHRHDPLSPPNADELSQKSLCHICPQPLHISKISADVATTGYALPGIIHRIESYLIAQEACQMLELDLSPALALEALTKDTNSTDDVHEPDPVLQLRSGMGNNYERLEFLGDTFLKMATTLAVYIKDQTAAEGELHVKRMLQLCNNNLYNNAADSKLYEYIRTKPFNRRRWYPSGIKLLEGKGLTRKAENDEKHHLGMKTIADVCEAIIGGAFLSHNRQDSWQPADWTQAVRAVTVMVQSEQHDMKEWADYRRAYAVPDWQLQRQTAAELKMIRDASLKDGYKFKNGRLLHCAFSHPSNQTMQEGVPSYQQLEWLGDALIDVVCVAHLMYQYPDKDPGWLTEHKMAMTCNGFLGALCVKLGFHQNIRHTSVALGTENVRYCHDLAEKEAASEGDASYWTAAIDPPKALADVVEAYVGAMFLDSGFDYGQVLRFFNEHMKVFFEDMTLYDTFANNHPVIRLNKRLGEDFGCKSYRLMVEELPSDGTRGDEAMAGLVIHASVIGGDHSKSGKYAKGRCANNALEELRGMNVNDFKKKFCCDCK